MVGDCARVRVGLGLLGGLMPISYPIHFPSRDRAKKLDKERLAAPFRRLPEEMRCPATVVLRECSRKRLESYLLGVRSMSVVILKRPDGSVYGYIDPKTRKKYLVD